MAQQINWIFRLMDERLNELEYKASKVGKKPDISRAEKMAILNELGILDKLLQLGISQKKIAQLLSIVINASVSNIEKDLSTRGNIDASFKNEEVYKSVVNTFNNMELTEYSIKAQSTLEKLESLRESNK